MAGLQGFAAFLCLMLIVLPAVAGGSWERVLIGEIAIHRADWILAVTLSEKAIRDPYVDMSVIVGALRSAEHRWVLGARTRAFRRNFRPYRRRSIFRSALLGRCFGR